MRTVVKITILFAFIFSFGCKKEDPTPSSPEITFIEASVSANNSYSTIKFEFIDGDGDLGLKQDEIIGDDSVNVFVDYYELNNGNWELKSPNIDTSFNWVTMQEEYEMQYFHARMPYIENEAQLSLEGDIEVVLLFNPELPVTPGIDTIRYEIYIKDRALHSSNVITTSELIIN
jgi:hypothetical protein